MLFLFVFFLMIRRPPRSTLPTRRSSDLPERFKDIFNKIVSIARDKGIVSDKLHIMDATDVRAKVDLYRIKKEHKAKEPDTYIDNHSPDKDARPGRKHGGRLCYGYKAHLVMDAESEIVLNVDTLPANKKEADLFVPLSKPLPQPKVVTADKAYDRKDNHRYLSKSHIRNGIILRKNLTKEYIKHNIKRVSRVAKSIRPVIEHKFADMKKHHGLALARYIGLIKTRIQVYMTAISVNVKRMIKLIYHCVSLPKISLRRVQTWQRTKKMNKKNEINKEQMLSIKVVITKTKVKVVFWLFQRSQLETVEKPFIC